MKIRVGDNVIINTGKDRGKAGVISKIYQGQNKVLVDGVNAKTKHVKGRDGVPGQRAEIFVPIHISNVSVVDAKSGKGSRVGYLLDAKGVKTRITKASGQAVTKAAPASAKAPADKPAKKKDSKVKTIKA